MCGVVMMFMGSLEHDMVKFLHYINPVGNIH